MTLRYHAIPRDLFEALAAGGGGSEAISVLAAAERSKHDALLRGVAAAAAEAGDATQARYVSIGREVLTEVARLDRDVADRVTGYPAVGAWAVSTLRALEMDGGAPAAIPARLTAVAAVAAVRSGIDAEVPVLPVDGVVSLPSLGAAWVDADSAVVRSRPGDAEVRWSGGRVEIPPGGDDAPGWLGIRDCRAGDLAAAIDDLDPFRMPAEVDGLAPRLTARQAQEWRRVLQQGWEVLATGHPAVAAEVAAAISVIVPLSRSVYGHRSSSGPDTFGALAMSHPPDPETCACTLTHELQHVKLCAVLDIVRLTGPNHGGRLYYAPWRDDPRPIAGLLQGAYAHVGVTEFWRRQRQLTTGVAQSRADGQFALWRAGTGRVIETLLASDQLTAFGVDFVRVMAETVGSWMSEPVSTQAQAFALREAGSHLARWERRHGPVPRPA